MGCSDSDSNARKEAGAGIEHLFKGSKGGLRMMVEVEF